CSSPDSDPSEFEFPIYDFDDYTQYLVDDDPYAPGYAPDPPMLISIPDTIPAPDSPEIPVWIPPPVEPLCPFDALQASYGFYPIELVPGSNPPEFIVQYPYPWDPSPPEYLDEWMMTMDTCRFLDHMMWYEGEWREVWGTYTGPVYRSLD
ncbi:hypothetical protein ABN226_18665, partial [Morganella morganii]|uniref:hypothetical protein n=1 Tax=Morganella morganii TaxID=582 RepID=UPI0032DB551B